MAPVPGDEANSWRPQMSRRQPGGSRCETLVDDTGHGLMSTGDTKTRHTV